MNHSSHNRVTNTKAKPNNHISSNSSSSAGNSSIPDSDLWRNFVKSIINPHQSDPIESSSKNNYQTYETFNSSNHEQNNPYPLLDAHGSINPDLNQLSNNSSFINSPWWDNDDATDDPDFTICHADLEDADLDLSFQVPSKRTVRNNSILFKF
jgi:hypothetical protein